MAYPYHWYGDPARVIERGEVWNAREEHGCAVCAFRTRDVTAWGRPVCFRGLMPMPRRAYCLKWRHEDE